MRLHQRKALLAQLTGLHWHCGPRTSTAHSPDGRTTYRLRQQGHRDWECRVMQAGSAWRLVARGALEWVAGRVAEEEMSNVRC